MINTLKRTSILDTLVLNQVQKDAVLYEGGPQLVFAGAGTGKTRVLTAKICFLIEKGIPPSQLFAATFTNKAAKEMRSRIEGFLNISCGGLWIGTFHSLCTRILRRECAAIGYQSTFSIYDSNDQLTLMKRILKKMDIDDRSMPPRLILNKISRFKSSCIHPKELEKEARGYRDQEQIHVYKEYQKALFDQQAMDFDDLITNVVILLNREPQILERYQNYFKYILVDEYQDTNTSQSKFLKLLIGKKGHIFAVGDDDQSIYRWRGAQIRNILSFEHEFTGTRVFKLEQNYRSTKTILAFANATIVQNNNRADKQLWSQRSEGDPVIVFKYRDDRQEAEMVAKRANLLTEKALRGCDIAILFRTNAQSRSFEESFRRNNVPYVLVGGTSFYERLEVKDCLAYLRLLVNPKDAISFERIYNKPIRGLGEKAFETITKKALESGRSQLETLLSVNPDELGTRSRTGFSELKTIFELLFSMYHQKEPPVEILKQMLEMSGYLKSLTDSNSVENESRAENIQELVNALAIWSKENSEKELSDFLEEVSLVSDIDTWEKKEQAVNLMTFHSAKGLEFKFVFLVGLEDGIIPSKQNFEDEEAVEEERRLMYVGATRAIDILECSYVEQRWRFGELLPQTPSRFLQSIPEEFYLFKNSSTYFGDSTPVKKAYTRQPYHTGSVPKRGSFIDEDQIPPPPVYEDFSQDSIEFRIGQHVKHKMYGRGKILTISGFGVDMKLTILFNDGNRKKLMAKFANLE